MEVLKIDHLLSNDLDFFSENAPLYVKHKDPRKGIVLFKFNNAQKILHEKIEKHIKKFGKCRVLVLKGRQQGVSTYVGARFYQRTSRLPANNTLIMTHKADATANLFSMTKRYHDNVDERLKTPTKTNSATDLSFEGLDSNYRVATAGSKESGRSYTVTNFHLSEYAFYKDHDAIKAGALQAVPEAEGTEIIIESTANGMNNDFYTMCMDALQGKGEYELIFIPWFIQEEYRSDVPSDFELTQDEIKLKYQYSLDNEQLMWRRKKINSFSGDVTKFMQEYPCNPQEAFQASGDSLIAVEDILNARKRVTIDSDAPVILGIDPGRVGDRAVIAIRQGRVFKNVIVFDTKKEEMKPMEFVQEIIKVIDNRKPIKAFIDTGEGGYAIYDRLCELEYSNILFPVSFGSAAIKNKVYANKRAEMWCNLKEFLHDENASIPDSDEIQADLMAMPDSFQNGSDKTQLISKKELKKEYGLSTDIGDAMCLTLAFPTSNLKKGPMKAKTNFNPVRPLKVKRKKML